MVHAMSNGSPIVATLHNIPAEHVKVLCSLSVISLDIVVGRGTPLETEGGGGVEGSLFEPLGEGFLATFGVFPVLYVEVL